MKKFIILIFLSFINLTFAQQEQLYFCNSTLDSFPIQQSGRIKPLVVHAEEMNKYLTGKKSVKDYSATVAYCLLSLKSLGLQTNIQYNAKVEHIKLKEILNVPTGILPFDELLDKVQQIRVSLQKFPEGSSEQKAAQNLLSQLGVYKSIKEGQDWMLPKPVANNEIQWLPIVGFFSEEEIKNESTQSSTPFLSVMMKSKEVFDKNVKSTYSLEYKYHKAKLTSFAMLATLLALAFLTLLKKINLALAFTFLAIILETAHLSLRVLISGRAPITNMYETVLFSGYGALVLAVIVGHFKKEKTFLYIGLVYNFLTLMMITFAGSMLSASISPLVPVLRDNFWLSTHVTTIIMSYGALALSWILANTVIFKKFKYDLSKADEKYYSDLIYTCLKYGTVMLGAGIILGGVWADYSWGRFWGWDPKETWSLIALCFYMAILHGRHTNWIPNNRFIIFTAGAFMSIMMAWFGVNYILASGLHSYGFSEGGAIFLFTFFTIQTIILILSWINFKPMRKLLNG